MNTCCKFCNKPAVGNTQPDLCEAHLDVAILAEYLADHQTPVTVETVQNLVTICQDRKEGNLFITAEDVPVLLAGPFADYYQVTSGI